MINSTFLRFVKEQLSLIEMELESLAEGTHPEFLARLEENEQSKLSQLKVLENSFEFMCKSIIHHHESMLSEAENSFKVRE